LALSTLLCAGFAAHAQVALSEGFANVAGLTGAGWSIVNTSASPGTTWFQGNSGIFSAAAGPANAYAAANFLGTTAASGPVSNWLITPQLVLDATSQVSFQVRAAGDNLLDRLEVLVSTTGTAPGNFSPVGSYESATDSGWVSRSFSLNLTATTPSYVAFRYVVSDVAVAGNYLGLDSVQITAVPEPTTSVLLGLGLAGLLLARRRLSA
jgi:hypothetical protein